MSSQANPFRMECYLRLFSDTAATAVIAYNNGSSIIGIFGSFEGLTRIRFAEAIIQRYDGEEFEVEDIIIDTDDENIELFWMSNEEVERTLGEASFEAVLAIWNE